MEIRDFRQMLSASSIDELEARVPNARPSERQRLIAYVNQGRLVADCVCGSGVACSMADDRAVCLACGRVHQILRPDTVLLDDVLRVLEPRPVEAQNWIPGAETRDDLAVENWVNGLPTTSDDAMTPASALRYVDGGKGRTASELVQLAPNVRTMVYNDRGERLDDRGRVIRGIL